MPVSAVKIGVRVVDDTSAPDGVRVEFIDEKEHKEFIETIFNAFADDFNKSQIAIAIIKLRYQRNAT